MKGGWYCIFCQYLHRRGYVCRSACQLQNFMLSEITLAEEMAVCRQKSHRGHLSTPLLRQVYSMHCHMRYRPLGTDGRPRSCVDGERGLLKKMPKRQTFRSSKPDLIRSLHCPGTQHPSACPAVSLPDRCAPRKQQPRGFVGRRAARLPGSGLPSFSYFIPGTTPATVPCT